ncbi:MAG: hypothetical protein HY290_33795 [Planctomycetia bacterium]|nr:hypothetical protein [Planctomycetia bacterium]
MRHLPSSILHSLLPPRPSLFPLPQPPSGVLSSIAMKLTIAFLLFLILVVGAVAYRSIATTSSSTTSPPVPLRAAPADALPSSSAPPSNAEDGPQPETSEEKHRRLLPGVWHDEYQGKRTMTLNDDGTGTMDVELSGVQASLFAAKLHFDMKWSLDGDKLIKTTVGGEPAKKVNLILKMLGDTAEDKILEITDERLLLLDKDGKTEYDWKRVQSQ